MFKQIILNEKLTTFWINEKGQLLNKKTNSYYKGTNRGGYLYYDLRFEGKSYSVGAHRLVAIYFLENPNNLPIVNHKDGNKLNNNMENLEWVTASDNNLHAYNIGLKKRTNGRESRQQYTNDLKNEIWLPYLNTNYLISNCGRIRNKKTNNLLKGKVTSDGYVEWCLSIEGKKKSYLTHRLVYQIHKNQGQNLEKEKVVNHIDGNKQNNSIENLELISQKENNLHGLYILNSKKLRQVEQYSLTGELLNTYPSCAAAARAVPGTYSNNISLACNGKLKTHHGFIWKYKN